MLATVSPFGRPLNSPFTVKFLPQPSELGYSVANLLLKFQTFFGRCHESCAFDSGLVAPFLEMSFMCVAALLCPISSLPLDGMRLSNQRVRLSPRVCPVRAVPEFSSTSQRLNVASGVRPTDFCVTEPLPARAHVVILCDIEDSHLDRICRCTRLALTPCQPLLVFAI